MRSVSNLDNAVVCVARTAAFFSFMFFFIVLSSANAQEYEYEDYMYDEQSYSYSSESSSADSYEEEYAYEEVYYDYCNYEEPDSSYEQVYYDDYNYEEPDYSNEEEYQESLSGSDYYVDDVNYYAGEGTYDESTDDGDYYAEEGTYEDLTDDGDAEASDLGEDESAYIEGEVNQCEYPQPSENTTDDPNPNDDITETSTTIIDGISKTVHTTTHTEPSTENGVTTETKTVNTEYYEFETDETRQCGWKLTETYAGNEIRSKEETALLFPFASAPTTVVEENNSSSSTRRMLRRDGILSGTSVATRTWGEEKYPHSDVTKRKWDYTDLVGSGYYAQEILIGYSDLETNYLDGRPVVEYRTGYEEIHEKIGEISGDYGVKWLMKKTIKKWTISGGESTPQTSTYTLMSGYFSGSEQ